MEKKNINPILVLAMGSTMQLFLGVLYIWSIFVNPVVEHFAMDVASAKLTSSFMISFFVVGLIVGGRIQIKISTHYTTLLGGLLLALGMFVSGILPTNMGVLLYLTYGIAGGTGVGMAYNAILTAIQKTFTKKRGLAIGISAFAFGFSTVVFAPLIEYLVSIIGLPNTFMTLAAAFTVATLVCFSFVRTPNEDENKKANNVIKKRQFTTKEMLKTKEFYYIALSMMLCTTTFFVLNPSFKSIGLERGLSDALATGLVMVTGIANALGRLSFPLLSDKIGSEKTTAVILFGTAISVTALIFVSGLPLILVIAAITFCYGGTAGVYPVITGDYFGIDNVGANYGCVLIGFALSSLFMPGAMNFVPGEAVRFIILAILALVGTYLCLILKKEDLEKY